MLSVCKCIWTIRDFTKYYRCSWKLKSLWSKNMILTLPRYMSQNQWNKFDFDTNLSHWKVIGFSSKNWSIILNPLLDISQNQWNNFWPGCKLVPLRSYRSPQIILTWMWMSSHSLLFYIFQTLFSTTRFSEPALLSTSMGSKKILQLRYNKLQRLLVDHRFKSNMF